MVKKADNFSSLTLYSAESVEHPYRDGIRSNTSRYRPPQHRRSQAVLSTSRGDLEPPGVQLVHDDCAFVSSL